MKWKSVRVSPERIRTGSLHALTGVLNSRATLILGFVPANVDVTQEQILSFLKIYDKAHIICMSGCGVISEDQLVDDEIVFTCVTFEKTLLKVVHGEISGHENTELLSRNLAGQLSGEDLAGVLVFADGMLVNGSELVDGINRVFNSGVPVTGGLAGTVDQQYHSWVSVGAKRCKGMIAMVAFYGKDFIFRYSAGSGWIRQGIWYEATKAKKNELIEINHRPALQMYCHILNITLKDLKEGVGQFHPIAIVPKVFSCKKVVRTVFKINEQHQSIILAGSIAEGSRIQLMTATTNQLVDGAEEATVRASEDVTVPGVVLAASCCGRRALMGPNTWLELGGLQGKFPLGSSISGFYTYGEICPYSSEAVDFHNQTMMVTYIAEG